MKAYIPRQAETTLKTLSRGFPIVAVTGPRQTGKTTLVQKMFPDKPYVNLETPDERSFAEEDPRGFIARFPRGAILDEIQRVPALFSWLQEVVDKSGAMGQFLITGSQHFGLSEKISQSLAGRVGYLQLLSFSVQELQNASQGKKSRSLFDSMFLGGYPPVHTRDLDARFWLDNYIQTYIERDVRQLINVRDLSTFQTFLRLSAGHCGQLLNLSTLADDVGITHNTAKAWISLLEASFVVFLLYPYYRNFNKRLVKTPKLYFYDSGLACRLLGIQESSQLCTHPLRGAIFESFIISEISKGYYNRGQRPPIWFWRDQKGQEVDLLIEKSDSLLPVEIKSGATIVSDYFDGIKKWNSITGQDGGMLIYGGEENYSRSGFAVRSWDGGLP